MIDKSKVGYNRGWDNLEKHRSSQKRLESLKRAAKNNPNYLGEKKYHPLYNIWRSFRFTQKGKKAGNDPRWNKYKDFYSDMIDQYEEGKRFVRKDLSKPFSNDNFMFLTDKEVGDLKKKNETLEINGISKTIEEWAIEHDLTPKIIRQRLSRAKKYGHSNERVLHGYKNTPNKKIRSAHELEKQKIRNKASGMISSYNNTDFRKGFSKGDLNIEWMIDNILFEECVYCGDKERIGADRVDNNKNHSTDNLVPCCYDCNVARGNNFSHEEMKEIGKTIAQIKKKRMNLN